MLYPLSYERLGLIIVDDLPEGHDTPGRNGWRL
jgi:hypothetical protein